MKSYVHTEKPRASKLWILVVLPVLAIPFEDEYSFFGYSLAKVTILPLFVAVILFQPARALSVCKHPIFLSGMAFLIWGGLAEAFHPSSDWKILNSMFQMFVFAALIASVSVNKVAFRRLLLSIPFICALLGLYLIYYYYGSVNIDAGNWREASRIRGHAFDDFSRETNLNVLAYTVGMGAIVSLAKVLAASKTGQRIFWGMVYAACALGSFTPLSRGALLAVLAGSTMILWRGLRKSSMRSGSLLSVLAVIAIVFALMPGALTARFSLFAPGGSVEEEGRIESRTRIFTPLVEALPEYWALGVGTGNYFEGWNRTHGLSLGPHNGFLAAWIYFGLPGLVLLCLICFVAGREFLRRADTSWEGSAVSGLLVLALVWLVFTHNLYFKAFGVVLGLAMAASGRASSSGIPRRPIQQHSVGKGARLAWNTSLQHSRFRRV